MCELGVWSKCDRGWDGTVLGCCMLDRVSQRGKRSSPTGESILLIANYESNVGYAWWLMENFWLKLAELFKERGGRAFLAYPKINEIPEKIRDSSITVLAHDFEMHSWHSLMSLKGIIKENNIAHVYLTDKKQYSLGYALLRSWGIKTIVNHDHSPRAAEGRSPLRQLLKRLIHKAGVISCDHYIGVSKFVRDRLVSYGGISPGKVSVVLNGIEPIEIDAGKRYYAHDNLGIPKDALVVVSTGRATTYKRVDALIECARRLFEGGDAKIYFLHCGDGPELAHFKRMVEVYGFGHRFIFAGRRNDIRQILPSCDIGIQISRGEAFSLSLLEYLSAGLATLASDVGGNPEAIVDGKTGILFASDDLDSVVRKIRELAANEFYRKQLGEAARESVRTNFNIARMNQDFIALYKDILMNN